jgi:hypothetical protein
VGVHLFKYALHVLFCSIIYGLEGSGSYSILQQ